MCSAGDGAELDGLVVDRDGVGFFVVELVDLRKRDIGERQQSLVGVLCFSSSVMLSAERLATRPML